MRQEQSRSKTPAARILSLALALCMIATFVPAMSLSASAAVDATYTYAEGADSYAFEFDLGTLTAYKDFGFVDADGYTFAGACDAWKKDDGFYVADGERSITLGSDFVLKTDPDKDIQYNDYSGSARIRVVVEKDTEAGTYTVSYSTVADSTATLFATAVYESATGPNGIAHPSLWDYSGWSNGVTAYNAINAFQNFTVYTEGEDGSIDYDTPVYTAGETVTCDITATYIDVDGSTYSTATGTMYDANIGGCIFPAISYTENGWNYFHTAPVTILSASEEVEMTTSVNPDVSGYYEGAQITIDSTAYIITSGNLIPNGDFTVGNDGFDGWYTPALNSLSSTYFTNNWDGTVTMPEESNNPYDYKRIMRDWALEEGETYLFTMYDSTANGWHRVTLTNTLAAENTNSYIFNGTSAGTNEKIFTNSTPYSYLHLQFRWNYTNETIGNFGLYKIEKDTSATEYTVTVEYTLDGEVVDSLTATKTVASGSDASFDEVNYFLSTGFYGADAVTYESVTADDTHTIALEEVPVWTWQSGKYNTGNLDDAGNYPARRNFAAFNWGGEGTYDRVGVAILDADAGCNTYTLNVTNARSYGSYTAYIYAVSYEAYSAVDLTSTSELTDLLAANTSLATITSSEGPTVTQIDLGNISSLIGDSGKVVILGTSIAGLYGIEGSTMSISSTNMYDVTYLNENDDTLGTLTVEEGTSIAAKTFYNEDDGTIYTADAVDAVTGNTEVTAKALDVIAPTYDGFLTPNTTDMSDVESYITADNDGMIRATGSSTDAFGVISMFDSERIGSGAEASKTRVGYLEFDVPVGYVAGDDISLILSVATIDSDAVGSYVGAIATTLDVDSLTDGEGTGSSIDLGIASTDYVYYSDAALTADTDTVTIDLTGIAADDGAVKVIIVVPRGEVRFANEERTVFGGTYEGQTAYVEVNASPAVTAIVALVDSDNNAVAYVTSEVSGDTTSVTVPAGIYGKQYYLDADTSVNVELDNEYFLGTLEISEISLFSWNNDAIVYSSNGEVNTYNVAVSATWNTARTAYAYADIPEVTDDTKILQVTVEAYYNNGTWQAPGTITLYSTNYDTVKGLDLAGGSEVTDALAELTFEEYAVLDVDLTDYDDTTRIGTFSVKIPTSDITGNAVFKILAGGNGNGSIASVRSISFDVVDKDYGVDLYAGAQIRVGSGMGTDSTNTEEYQQLLGDSGLRFIAVVDKTNTLAEIQGAEIGIAIFDGGFVADEITAATAKEKFENATPVTKIKDDVYQDEAAGVFTAAIVNIDESNYNRIYVAVPYVEVDGTRYYNWSATVARTPYEVAKGILVNGTTTTGYTQLDGDGETVDSNTEALINVLNVYTNKTGARITVAKDSDGYTIVAADYANGATEFFTVSEDSTLLTSTDGTGTIILVPKTNSVKFYDYAGDYYRVNNAHDAFITAKGATADIDEDGNLVITIPASSTGSDGDNDVDAGDE